MNPKRPKRSWRNRHKYKDGVAPPAEVVIPGLRGVIGAPTAMRRDIFELLVSFAHEQPVISGRTGGEFDTDRDFNRLIAEFVGDDESQQWDNMAMLPWPQVYEMVDVFSGEIWRRRLFLEFGAKLNPILERHGAAWQYDPTVWFQRLLSDGTRIEPPFDVVERLSGERQGYELGIAVQSYEAIPRKERPTCDHIYRAALEVAQVRLNDRTLTLDQAAQLGLEQGIIEQPLTEILTRIVAMRDDHFAMMRSFSLSPAEVDVIYAACSAAIVSFGPITPPGAA